MSGASPVSSLRAQVRRTVRDRGLFGAGTRVLVAISGGADSTALLGLLSSLADELGIELAAASVDHGLRPGSAADVEVAARSARTLDVPFEACAATVAPGGSIEAKARTARYAALQAEAQRVGASVIAVGHSADDQAETVLSRLLRGAGIRGLGAMSALRDGHAGRASIARPLIDCRRADLRAYVDEAGLPYVIDESNRDDAFERTRLRERVVPALIAEDARVIEHLCDVAEEAREIDAWITASLVAPPDAARLPLEALVSLPDAIAARVIRRWLATQTGRAPRRAHLREALGLRARSGRVLLGGGWVIERDTDALRVLRDSNSRGRSEPDDR